MGDQGLSKNEGKSQLKPQRRVASWAIQERVDTAKSGGPVSFALASLQARGQYPRYAAVPSLELGLVSGLPKQIIWYRNSVPLGYTPTFLIYDH